MTFTEQWTFAVILTLATLLCGTDLAADYRSGTDLRHLALEGLLLLSSLAGLAHVLRSWWADRQALATAQGNLSETRADLTRFQAQARGFLDGLGQAIDAQFEDWQLTPAEKEIGLLTLKGLSFKEVAQVRRTSERTVRKQARAIYAKADLSGRVAFAAFFLEDLLLPQPVLPLK